MKEARELPASAETKRTVALLDVDGTLIGHDNQLNEGLLSALQENGISDVYLFTSMSLNDIMYEKADRDIEKDYFSRPWLVKQLIDKGFVVHGVITPADPSYNQGLGRAYSDIFVPQHDRFIVNNEVENPDREFKDPKSKFLTAHHQFESLAKRTKRDHEKYMEVKGGMYEFFLVNKPGWIEGVVFIDDSNTQIESVEAAHTGYCRDGMRLDTIHTTGNKKVATDPLLLKEYFKPEQPRLSELLPELPKFNLMIETLVKSLPKEWGKYLSDKLNETASTSVKAEKSKKELDAKQIAMGGIAATIKVHHKQVMLGNESCATVWREGLSDAVQSAIDASKDKSSAVGKFFKVESKVAKALTQFKSSYDKQFSGGAPAEPAPTRKRS